MLRPGAPTPTSQPPVARVRSGAYAHPRNAGHTVASASRQNHGHAEPTPAQRRLKRAAHGKQLKALATTTVEFPTLLSLPDLVPIEDEAQYDFDFFPSASIPATYNHDPFTDFQQYVSAPLLGVQQVQQQLVPLDTATLSPAALLPPEHSTLMAALPPSTAFYYTEPHLGGAVSLEGPPGYGQDVVHDYLPLAAPGAPQQSSDDSNGLSERQQGADVSPLATEPGAVHASTDKRGGQGSNSSIAAMSVPQTGSQRAKVVDQSKLPRLHLSDVSQPAKQPWWEMDWEEAQAVCPSHAWEVESSLSPVKGNGQAYEALGSNATTLFAKGLDSSAPESLTRAALLAVLGRCGCGPSVTQLRLPTSATSVGTRRLKGIAYIVFESEAAKVSGLTKAAMNERCCLKLDGCQAYLSIPLPSWFLCKIIPRMLLGVTVLAFPNAAMQAKALQALTDCLLLGRRLVLDPEPDGAAGLRPAMAHAYSSGPSSHSFNGHSSSQEGFNQGSQGFNGVASRRTRRAFERAAAAGSGNNDFEPARQAAVGRGQFTGMVQHGRSGPARGMQWQGEGRMGSRRQERSELASAQASSDGEPGEGSVRRRGYTALDTGSAPAPAPLAAPPAPRTVLAPVAASVSRRGRYLG
ncbi:hypothetical protein QJQ45_023129 [Haematococcus lacustris]|nr:hypothetical protein QJQ45_023129 [Haematococcus lacustris]